MINNQTCRLTQSQLRLLHHLNDEENSLKIEFNRFCNTATSCSGERNGTNRVKVVIILLLRGTWLGLSTSLYLDRTHQGIKGCI